MPASWSLAAAAIVFVVAALGVLAGRLLFLRRHDAALRAVRSELQLADALDDRWSWRTDGAHRLLHWRPPAGSGGAEVAAGSPLWSLFGDDGSLRHRLDARHALHALRATSDVPLAGSRGWLLSGGPRTDAEGRFDGFTGWARPTDGDDALHAAAAALPALLAASGDAALVARRDAAGDGWRVCQLNAAAAEQMPNAAVGEPLADPPPSIGGALDELGPGASVGSAGWQASNFGPLEGGGEGLLLVQRAAAERTPGDEEQSFGFTLSHDLRAPIRVVEGFTRIVKEDYGRQLDRVGNDHLDRVLGAAARMNAMIDALLALARLSAQPLARQPVNLSQLAAFVVDDLRRSTPGREVDVRIEADLTAQGDPTLLRLVLENLLGNAWKYSARAVPAQVSFGRSVHGSRTAYTVRDNGAGFDMRSAERLFGLFQRLHSATDFPGTGVGLASVKRIVRRHGGEIWAEAEPGRGAAFHFTLRP